jgi:hypothetical protein
MKGERCFLLNGFKFIVEDFWHQCPSEHILTLVDSEPGNAEMVIRAVEPLATRALGQTRKLCCLVDKHPPRRNPLRIEEWVCNALDDSFVHPRCNAADITDLKRPFNDAELEVRLNEWRFTALDMGKDDILRLVWRIFEEFGLLSEVDNKIFAAFLHAIYANYFDNPYHNIYHVVDVLQCCYFLLKFRVPQLRAILTKDDIFALCVACLCHDVGHPSFGNSILRESGHPLSILYNDTSVLENMHATILFSILRQPCYDFLRGWSEERRKRFRRRVVAWILATDMSSHFDFIRKFDEGFPSLDTGHSVELTEEQRGQLCIALIKCSDISNVIRPFEVAKRWGVALLNEFLVQGDYERLLGLPVSPLNDRSSMKTGPGQYNFLTMVAAPLYRSIARKIEGLELFEELIAANAGAWRHFNDSSIAFDS